MKVETMIYINGQNLHEAKTAVFKNADYDDKAIIIVEAESDVNGCSIQSANIKYLLDEDYEMTINKRFDVMFKKRQNLKEKRK